MESLQTILFVLQVLVALCLIGFILIQHGKGADAGAAFGSGASTTVFGSQGSGNFLTRTTTALAFIFLANSLALAYIATERMRQDTSLIHQTDTGIMQQQQTEQPSPPDTAPAVPEGPESDAPRLPVE
ncbi:MAG: preprotein translocase subunit SecG [Gammaproteobacteria bacterium]